MKTNRQLALDAGEKTYHGQPCKRGHGTLKRTSNRHCVICDLTYTKKYRQENPDYDKKYRQENKDKISDKNKKFREKYPDYFKKYYQENKDKISDKNKKYKQENPDYNKKYYQENKDKISDRKKKYRQNNPDKINADNLKRRAIKYSAINKMLFELFKEKIQALYAKAKQLTRDTGIPHHVHHYIPLALGGTNSISNLYVIPDTWNLQIGSKDPNNLTNPEDKKLREQILKYTCN